MVTPPGILNTIILPNPDSATGQDVAKMLAVALIDKAYPLIRSDVLSSKPPNVMLRSDGSFRHKVIRNYSPSVYKAISVVSEKILSEYEPILRGIYLILRGEIPENLDRFNSDYLVDSDEHPMYVVNLEDFVLEIDELMSSVAGLPHYKKVALEYIADRYLSHLSKEKLLDRGNDIFRNIFQLNDKGQITLENEESIAAYWMDLWSEFLQECLMRGITEKDMGPTVAGQSPFKGKDPRPKSIGQRLKDVDIPTSPYLVKYGKREHLDKLHKEGILRIAPASEFDDPSMNTAQKDNEQSIQFEIDVTSVPVMGPGAEKNTKRHIPLSMDLNTNYYVTCLSEGLRHRLFIDFDADACLVIKDPDVFKDLVISALSAELTGFQFKAERVTYYDPLSISPVDLEPIFHKHHRYTYQEEVRIIAVPNEPTTILEPVFINLGSLTEISNVIDITKTETKH